MAIYEHKAGNSHVRIKSDILTVYENTLFHFYIFLLRYVFLLEIWSGFYQIEYKCVLVFNY